MLKKTETPGGLRTQTSGPRLDAFLWFLIYFAAITAVQARWIHFGFTGDAAGYVAPNTLEMSKHPWIPYAGYNPGVNDTGHPLFHAWLIAAQWSLFGVSAAITNLNLWAWAALALLMTHLFADRVARGAWGEAAPRWIGPLAALCLFCQPLFISHASRHLQIVPHTAIFMTMLWAWIAGRRWVIALAAVALPLGRVDGAFYALGLGLFDFGQYVLIQKRRSPREMALRLAPYAAGAVGLGIYYFVKLKILHLPFSTFGNHTLAPFTSLLHDPGATFFQRMGYNWRLTHTYLMRAPVLGMYPMLWAAAAGGVAITVRRRLGRETKPDALASAQAPVGPRAAMWGFFAALILPAIFYFVYGEQLLYRRYMPHQIFIPMTALLLGTAALGRWRTLVIPVTLAWCALMTARWHEGWIQKLTGGRNEAFYLLRVAWPIASLDVQVRKELNQDLAGAVLGHPAASRYIGGRTGIGLLSAPACCFMESPILFNPPDFMEKEHRTLDWIEQTRTNGEELYLIDENFVYGVEREASKRLLEKYPQFKLDQTLNNALGEEIRIYRFIR